MCSTPWLDMSPTTSCHVHLIAGNVRIRRITRPHLTRCRHVDPATTTPAGCRGKPRDRESPRGREGSAALSIRGHDESRSCLPEVTIEFDTPLEDNRVLEARVRAGPAFPADREGDQEATARRFRLDMEQVCQQRCAGVGYYCFLQLTRAAGEVNPFGVSHGCRLKHQMFLSQRHVPYFFSIQTCHC